MCFYVLSSFTVQLLNRFSWFGMEGFIIVFLFWNSSSCNNRKNSTYSWCQIFTNWILPLKICTTCTDGDLKYLNNNMQKPTYLYTVMWLQIAFTISLLREPSNMFKASLSTGACCENILANSIKTWSET